MRNAHVYCRGVLAGVLSKDEANGYSFQYCPEYLTGANLPPISLSFPKQAAHFESPVLFPFFFGLLPAFIYPTSRERTSSYSKTDSRPRVSRPMPFMHSTTSSCSLKNLDLSKAVTKDFWKMSSQNAKPSSHILNARCFQKTQNNCTSVIWKTESERFPIHSPDGDDQ